MFDQSDPHDWHDPDSGRPPEKEPSPIWDALHQLIDDLQIWAGLTARLGRELRALVQTITWQSLLFLMGSGGAYQIATGLSIRNMAVANPTRVAIGVLLVAPLAQPAARVLISESRRHQKRAARVTEESLSDYDSRIVAEARKQRAIGRQLDPHLDLPSLQSTRDALDAMLMLLQDDKSSLIITRANDTRVDVVFAVGNVEPDLSEGIGWGRDQVESGSVPYGTIVRELGLHHAYVHFFTGAQAWDVVCVASNVLSDRATVQLAQAVTRLLGYALEEQRKGNLKLFNVQDAIRKEDNYDQ